MAAIAHVTSQGLLITQYLGIPLQLLH